MPPPDHWDVFLSHAWEDKDDFVRPLAEALRAQGLTVWYDEFTLTVGDRLRRSVDKGVARCDYGIVVLSPHFLEKEWPQRELDGLATRENDDRKVILPVWHGIDAATLAERSPTLADRIGISSERGVESVVQALLRAMGREPVAEPAEEEVGSGSPLKTTALRGPTPALIELDDLSTDDLSTGDLSTDDLLDRFLSAADLQERLRCGRALGERGDPRPGVGLDAHGLPDIAWVQLPAGRFPMGTPEGDEDGYPRERPPPESRHDPRGARHHGPRP